MRGGTSASSVWGDTRFSWMPSLRLAASAIAAQTIFSVIGTVSSSIVHHASGTGRSWASSSASTSSQSVEKLSGVREKEHDHRLPLPCGCSEHHAFARLMSVTKHSDQPVLPQPAVAVASSVIARCCISVLSRINQPRDFLRTEYSRQLPGPLGKRNLIEQIGAPQGLDEEKPQSRTSTSG